MRLTDKTSVEFTPECSKVNPLITQGKCPYYEKLREFEDFMEEQGFESLEHLELHLKNLAYGAKYYVFWEKLKEYITQKIETDYDWCAYVYPEGLEKMQEILEKMQKLEE